MGRERRDAQLYGNGNAEIREQSERDAQGWRKTGCRKSIAIPSDNVCLGSRNGKRRKGRAREKVGPRRQEDSVNYTKSKSSRKGGERTGKDKIRERWMVMLGEG